jgi:hypothetical protein
MHRFWVTAHEMHFDPSAVILVDCQELKTVPAEIAA